MATTAFFANTHGMIDVFDRSVRGITGYDMELVDPDAPKEGVFKRYFHAAFMTAAFHGYSSLTRKVVSEKWENWAKSKGFGLKQPSEIGELSKRAEAMRNERIYRTPKEFISNFKILQYFTGGRPVGGKGRPSNGSTEVIPENSQTGRPEVFEGGKMEAEISIDPGNLHTAWSLANGFKLFGMNEKVYHDMANHVQTLKQVEALKQANKVEGVPSMSAADRAQLKAYMKSYDRNVEGKFRTDLSRKHRRFVKRYESYIKRSGPDSKEGQWAQKMIEHANGLKKVMENPESRVDYVIRILQMENQLEAQANAFEQNAQNRSESPQGNGANQRNDGSTPYRQNLGY